MELESQSLRVRNVIQSVSVAYRVIYIQVFGTLMKRWKHGMCG